MLAALARPLNVKWVRLGNVFFGWGSRSALRVDVIVAGIFVAFDCVSCCFITYGSRGI